MKKNNAIAAFQETVWTYWKKNGRYDLPWRKTTDPYKILVSEMMLQQTQVSRIIPKYKSFLRKFPTARALARAPLSEVLKEWSGLGYNRRAKYLHDVAADMLSQHGVFSNQTTVRLKNKGIGPYTKAAVRTFAFNEPNVFLETNIRTVFIHHFFPRKKAVSDKELLPLVEAAAVGQDPRTWYWALMDYGSHLKQSGVRNNAKSKHYTKQSRFEGSLRQIRGAILRELYTGDIPDKRIYSLIRANKRIVYEALKSLTRDGLIVEEKGKWRIA